MSPTRRDFLKSMVGTTTVLSLAPTFPTLLERSVLAAESALRSDDTVLIILQLSGGNDGLNTVVPYADDAYGRGRTTLRLTDRQVIKIDSYLGLHPEMEGFHKLLDEGLLAVVQGVGYPKNNRGHDEAMREWHTARPGDMNCPTGWVGRTVDTVSRPDQADVPAAFVGPIAAPFALNAEASVVPAIRTANQLTLQASSIVDEDRKQIARGLDQPGGDSANSLAQLVRRGTLQARLVSQRVEAVLAADKSMAEYPSFTLSQQLRTISQLIQADLGIRIFFVELGGGGIGGFDNHANQRDNHAALLKEMSASITAFVRDLQKQELLSRVLLMTFSEFGRTLTENGRRGTDHGAAAPIFMAGGRVKGGVLGAHPSLTDLDQDAPKFHTDYRRVYATVLQQWLGFDAQAVLGDKYAPIEVLA